MNENIYLILKNVQSLRKELELAIESEDKELQENLMIDLFNMQSKLVDELQKGIDNVESKEKGLH